MTAASSRRSEKMIGPTLVILGVGYQWLYNGVNFLAFKVGADAFPPLMLAALRFGIAATLILPLAAWRWHFRPAWMREVAGTALLGLVMLIGSQTLAIWGTHFLPAGVASVFGSAAPVFIALLAWVVFREAPGGRQLVGIASRDDQPAWLWPPNRPEFFHPRLHQRQPSRLTGKRPGRYPRSSARDD